MQALLHPAVSALALLQATQLNLFERFLEQAVSGIDSTSITSGMQNIAYVVLLVGFLWQVYQSALHGGDVRGLGTNLIKYVVTAVIVMNYHAVFTAINQGFVNAGNWINSASGATNLLDNWANDLKTQYNQQGFQNLWGLVTGATAGVLDGVLIIVAYILYPLVIAIFGFFYILYGSILYIFGPIVIALMPLGATSRLAKSYVENVFIWNAWPVLYGGFGALLSAVQMGQISQMLNQNNFLGGLGNLEGSILIGLTSIIYSLAIAVIPFIAKRIVSGEVGATAGTLAGAAVTALTAGVAATEGIAAGVAARSGQAASGGGAAASGTSYAVGTSIASSGRNLPAAAQRMQSANVSGQPANRANAEASSADVHSVFPLPTATQGQAVADSIRGGLESAVDPMPKAVRSGSPSSAGSSVSTTGGAAADGGIVPTPGVSGEAKPSSKRSAGPTPALMRPHGLATWGAYHAARLATQGAVGVSRAASGIANPVDTARKVGAKGGELAGRAANAVDRTTAAVAAVRETVTHPGDAMTTGVRTMTSTVREAAAGFSEAYERTRSQEDSNDRSA